jgi:hypothetical protein
MSNKTFSHVGVSRLNGVVKARFANDALRVKVLTKGGHTDIDMLELKAPMSKVDAIEYLIKIDFAAGRAEVAQALEEALDRRAPKAADKQPKKTKEAKKPKKAPAKSKDITLDSIMAKAMKPSVTKAEVQKQLDEAEDAPF